MLPSVTVTLVLGLTIGFRQNLLPGYQQKGADKYAANICDVINIAEDFISYFIHHLAYIYAQFLLSRTEKVL